MEATFYVLAIILFSLLILDFLITKISKIMRARRIAKGIDKFVEQLMKDTKPIGEDKNEE